MLKSSLGYEHGWYIYVIKYFEKPFWFHRINHVTNQVRNPENFLTCCLFFLNSNFIESARDLAEMFLNDKFHFNNIQYEYTFN